VERASIAWKEEFAFGRLSSGFCRGIATEPKRKSRRRFPFGNPEGVAGALLFDFYGLPTRRKRTNIEYKNGYHNPASRKVCQVFSHCLVILFGLHNH
jgi:hypothetical protein